MHELSENNTQISALCLQETWLKTNADLSMFQIPNYNIIFQGKNTSEHGGLVIYMYLHKSLAYSYCDLPVKPDIWECMFVKNIY